MIKGAGDVRVLRHLQVRESRGQGGLEHIAGGPQLAGKALQVNKRRPQVVRNDVGKALNLLIRGCQFGGTLLHAYLQLIAGLAQCLLRLHARAEVVHDAGKEAQAVQVYFTHGQRHGKRCAIAALSPNFTPDADDVRLSRLEITRQIAVVFLPVG